MRPAYSTTVMSVRWLVVLCVVSACGSSSPENDPADAPGPGSADVVLPPLDGGFDYQLGGPYEPPTNVMIVSRDRTAPPAPGLYNICYVNGFQIQPDEAAMWQAEHPDLILRDDNGQPIIDVEWNEMLIDVSTAAKRDQVAAIVGGSITGCADAGFDAIEIDNLDSFTRSGGHLVETDAIAMMARFSETAHGRHLAIAQKNASDLVARHAELGTDFAVAEECNQFDECDVYRAGYGDHVLVIEYQRAAFTTGCGAFPSLSIVLRDLELVTPGDPGYVYDGC